MSAAVHPLVTGTVPISALESARLAAVEAFVDLARELNDRRAPDHQERMAKAVASVREYFRDSRGDLPTKNDWPLAQVADVLRASGSSPEGYGRAIDALAISLDERRHVSRRPISSRPRL